MAEEMGLGSRRIDRLEGTRVLWAECNQARKVEFERNGDPKQAHAAAKTVWNAWAEPLREEFDVIAKRLADKPTPWKHDNADFDKWVREQSPEWREWIVKSLVDFRGDSPVEGKEPPKWAVETHQLKVFLADAGSDFSEFIFPGPALFEHAFFPGGAKFDGAKFHGDARFGGATFSKDASFSNTTFYDDAWFGRCRILGQFMNFEKADFKGSARFREVQFSGVTVFDDAEFWTFAWFPQAQFSGFASFNRAKFCGEAIFGAMRSSGSFSLVDTEFSRIPDFTEAHFDEAPLLDRIKLKEPPRWRTMFRYSGLKEWPKTKEQETIDRDTRGYGEWQKTRNRPAMWRALRRVANQGKDHLGEVDFYACEVREMRLAGTGTRVGNAIGILYDAFSNFGRSIARPFIAWLMTTLGFAYFFWRMRAPSSGATQTFEGIVVDDACDKVLSAVYIAFKKSFVVSIDQTEKLNQQYVCLYGRFTDKAAGYTGMHQVIPVLPDFVVFMGILQSALSATFLFLFFLALKNQFRAR